MSARVILKTGAVFLWNYSWIHGYGKRIYVITQPAFTFSKLAIETLEQGVKCVQS